MNWTVLIVDTNPKGIREYTGFDLLSSPVPAHVVVISDRTTARKVNSVDDGVPNGLSWQFGNGGINLPDRIHLCHSRLPTLFGNLDYFVNQWGDFD